MKNYTPNVANFCCQDKPFGFRLLWNRQAEDKHSYRKCTPSQILEQRVAAFALRLNEMEFEPLFLDNPEIIKN